MADKTIGEIIKQFEIQDGSDNKDNLPIPAQIEVNPIIEIFQPNSISKAETFQEAVITDVEHTVVDASDFTSTSNSVLDASKENQPDQTKDSGDSVLTAFKSTTGNLIKAMDIATKSQVVEAGGKAVGGPFYSAIQEIKQVKNDPLVKAIKDYFVPSEQSESSDNTSETSTDYTSVLDKMDEIKDVLESNQKDDLKLFKREQRLERRRARKLLRATKKGKGGSGDGFLGKVFGRGIGSVMKKFPKIGAALSSFGSVVAGVAAPITGVVSVIGGAAMIGKDAFDIFKSWKEGGWEAVKGRDVGGVSGGLAGAGIGAAIGTAILPGVGTLIGAGIGAIAGNFFGEKAGKAMEEDPEKKAARIEKAEREEQQRKAQKAKEIADKARKSRKNEEGFDYVDDWMKKKPSAAITEKSEKKVHSAELIKDRRELVTSKTVQAGKKKKDLITAKLPTINNRTKIVEQAKAAAMQKMTAQVQNSDAKKQLDALIAEFKGMRKDMKKQLDTPREIQNPLLRETIIQSKNLFK